MSKEETKTAVAEQAEEKKEKVEEKVEKVEAAPVAPESKKDDKAAQTQEPAKEESGEAKVEEKVKPVKEETAEAKKETKPVLSPKMEEIMTSIEQMTVLELSELVKALEDKFGVTAAMPMVGAMPGGAAGGGEAPAEEKTTFDVVLDQVGEKKIQVIKELRVVTSLGLKEAKELVDNAPKPVKEGATKEEAEEIKGKLEAVGATVVLK